jgi:integrase
MGTLQPKKSGRPRSGSVEPAGTWEDDSPRFRVRIRLADGTKSDRHDVPHGQDAKAYAAYLQSEEDVPHGLLLAKQAHARAKAAAAHVGHDLETCDDWFARYLPTKECGATHRRISASVWKKWITPVIGPKPIATLTRDDIEDVRDRLDTALDAKEIRHSTARNAWGVSTEALKSAYAARDRSLRIHAAPMHYGILPPKHGDSRQRPWLYPREWAQLVTCADVPVEFRQLYAIALYTGLRPSELRALNWGDVDADARTITVSKAYERESKSVKAPKTLQGQRIVPLHEHLAPLLEKLRGEADEPVAPMLSVLKRGDDRFALTFREHLHAAKLERPRLVADTDTEEPIDFRSLRDSYATWSALAGVGDRVLQRRMGHASPATTDRYVKAAESFDAAAIGEPFPPLPEEILKEVWPNDWPRNAKTPGKRRGFLVARVGFEPTTFGL